MDYINAVNYGRTLEDIMPKIRTRLRFSDLFSPRIVWI
jgi:hypothetical protein